MTIKNEPERMQNSKSVKGKDVLSKGNSMYKTILTHDELEEVRKILN